MLFGSDYDRQQLWRVGSVRSRSNEAISTAVRSDRLVPSGKHLIPVGRGPRQALWVSFDHPQSATERFGFIIATLRQVVWARGGLAGLLTGAIYNLLSQVDRRFQALAAQIRAGTYRARPSRANGPSYPRRPPPPPLYPSLVPPPLPRRMSKWLLRLLPPLAAQHAGNYAVYLRQLLEDPEMVALMAVAPEQMRRILRPLGTMLGMEDLFPPVPRKNRTPSPPVVAEAVAGRTYAQKPLRMRGHMHASEPSAGLSSGPAHDGVRPVTAAPVVQHGTATNQGDPYDAPTLDLAGWSPRFSSA